MLSYCLVARFFHKHSTDLMKSHNHVGVDDKSQFDLIAGVLFLSISIPCDGLFSVGANFPKW